MPLFGQIAVLGLGGWLAMHGEVTLGTFLAFASYVTGLMGPARFLAAAMVTAQVTKASVNRVHELIDSQPDVKDGTEDDPRAEGRDADLLLGQIGQIRRPFDLQLRGRHRGLGAQHVGA